jgi:Flp pilus assembly protein TadD
MEAQKKIIEIQDQIAYLRSTRVATRSPEATIERQIRMLEEEVRRLEASEPPVKEAGHEAPGEVYFFIGNALFNLGRVDEAVVQWERCREKSPKFPLVYNNLAVAYWRSGRREEARQMLARAEELGFPVDPRFKEDLAASP